MKKTAILTAAMFAMTALSTPARANDDAIRLGIGIAGALIGEAMKGGGNRQNGAQPRKGDQMIGRVDGKPIKGQKQEPRQTAKKRQAAPASDVAYAPLPEIVPTPEDKPTADEMAAWIAAAPEREAMEAQAEAEIAADLAPVAEPTTTTTANADDDGQRDLLDENGKLWGSVPEEMANRVWQAVDLGMKPSQAIPAITGLADPSIAEAKAKADAEAVAQAKAAEDEKARQAVAAMLADKPAEETAKVAENTEAAPSIVEAEKTAEAEQKPAVDAESTTAAIDKPTLDVDLDPPAEKPAEKAKPKLDVDL